MKNVILTASDAKFGDFLINHWLYSLKDNVNLDSIDIAVLDYSMTANQIKHLKDNDVIIQKCATSESINIARFMDAIKFLHHNKYSQILFSDSGDIIFQEDINHLFHINKNSFRVVIENIKSPIWKFNSRGKFSQDEYKNVMKTFSNNSMINCGFILAPADQFKYLCQNMFDILRHSQNFGPGLDQLIINHLLYKVGFIPLDIKYNFIIWGLREKFFIDQGVFYLNTGEKIAVVHNGGGGSETMRAIKNFGYGDTYNQPKRMILWLRKIATLLV